jgi:3-deoxy-D-manno-octulosonic-acid transferase
MNNAGRSMNETSFLYSLYRSLTTGLYYSLSPTYWLFQKILRISRPEIDQRLGRYNKTLFQNKKNRPIIWIHAASVGEVSAAAGIIEKLHETLPEYRIIFSTTTKHGQSSAIRLLGDRVHCVYAPLDFIASVRKALRFFMPDILVCIETEIWPNWLYEAHKMGVKTAIINGRISSRSINNYVKFKSLFQHILQQVEAFSMIRKEDAARIQLLGAPGERVQVNGNSKYDRLAKQPISNFKKNMNALFNLSEQDMVFVAGSTRTHEEEIILDAYKRICRVFPDTKLIIAPRHIERTPSIEKLLKNRNMDYQLRTTIADNNPRSKILILDTIGELQATYSIASVVFCGGSLVPLGGHNILEAAAMGKPVFYGPYMDDFSDARELLETHGGGGVVRNAQELSEKTLDLLKNPKKAVKIGKNALNAVSLNQGASERHAAVIKTILDV